MTEQKIQMPSSGGGLVRYFDDEQKSRLEIKPEYVVAIIILIIIIGVYLHKFGL